MKKVIQLILFLGFGLVVVLTGCQDRYGDDDSYLNPGIESKEIDTTWDMEENEIIQSKEINMKESLYSVPSDMAASSFDVTYGNVKLKTYESKTTGSSRKVNVILPPNYSEKETYPVLYLLHGIGGDQNEWMLGNPDKILGNLIHNGDAKSMIIVLPNVRARRDDSVPSNIFSLEHFAAFDNFINDLRDDLMPFIEETYSIKTGRENTAIAGLSMGGRESLYIGFSMPDTFGYIGAFSPAIGLFSYSSGGIDEPGLIMPENLKLPEAYGDTMVMIVNGDNDTVVHDWPIQYRQALVDNGVDHHFYITPGGHDMNVWKHGLYNFAKRLFW